MMKKFYYVNENDWCYKVVVVLTFQKFHNKLDLA